MKKLNVKVSFKEQVKASYNVKLGIIVTQSDVIMIDEKTNIPVLHKNDIVWSVNSRFACAGKAGLQDVIYVDDFFLVLPKYVQEFIIQHELGHISSNHNEQIKKPLLHSILRIFKLSELEVEADKCAVKVLGLEKCKDGLLYLINDVNFPLSSKLELKKRLKVIEK